MIRRLGWTLGLVVLTATGLYTIVYVYRWEWNRALFTGVLFLIIEVALATVLVLSRLRRIEDTLHDDRQRAPSGRIRETRPDHQHFAWLERATNRPSVFVTVLLGAGVVLSMGTWLIDRIASRTSVPALERDLARRLEAVAFPTEPLVPDDAELVAEGGPYGSDHLDILLGPRP